MGFRTRLYTRSTNNVNPFGLWQYFIHVGTRGSSTEKVEHSSSN
jgi:hypothetical protein